MIRKLPKELKPKSPVVVREPVLIEGSSDGYLKFFAGKNVDVLFVNRPHCTNIESAIAAEQLIDEMLPRRFRPLYGANSIRGTAQIEKLTPADLARRVHNVELIEALSERKTDPCHIIRRILAG